MSGSDNLIYFIRHNAHRFSDEAWIGASVDHVPVPDGFHQRIKAFSEGPEESTTIRIHPYGETSTDAMEFIYGLAKRCKVAKAAGFHYEVSTDIGDVLLCVRKG